MSIPKKIKYYIWLLQQVKNNYKTKIGLFRIKNKQPILCFILNEQNYQKEEVNRLLTQAMQPIPRWNQEENDIKCIEAIKCNSDHMILMSQTNREWLVLINIT